MNDEGVVKVLQESREAANKLIAKLEVDNQYRPISNVQIAKYQLLVSEISDAIRYLETPKDDPTVCKECGEDMVIYCPDCCTDDAKNGWTNCDQWRLPE